MALHDPQAEAEQLDLLIAAHTEATETEILISRASTVRAVAELAEGLNCDEDEAEALVRAGVLGGAVLVGERIAGEVNQAIRKHVQPLAEKDLAEAKRTQRELSTTDRIHRYLDRVAA